MKITEVSVTLFEWPATQGGYDAAYALEASGGSNLGLVTVRTDAGLEGNAFLGSFVQPADLDAKSLVHALKPVLIGRDPLDRDRLHAEMWLWKRSRLTTVRCIAAVDIALWDIAGKIAGLPLHQLMGGYRREIPAYASSQVLAGPQQYAEEARRYRDMGWTAYKIHPPQQWREDIAVCEAARDAVGDGFALMLDSMWAYRFDEALQVGRAIESLHYLWFEDPLGEQDLYNYVKLCAKLDVPVMATEYPAGGLDAYVPWLEHRATDFLRGDVAVKGGITPLIKIAHLAQAFHLDLEIHHGANSLNNVANLHVALAIPNCRFFEVMLPDALNKFGLCRDIEVDGSGLVHAPLSPGLGFEIDHDRIRRTCIGRIT